MLKNIFFYQKESVFFSRCFGIVDQLCIFNYAYNKIIIMYSKYLREPTLRYLDKLIPDMELTCQSRLVNYISMKVQPSGMSWHWHPSYYSPQHYFTKAYMQMNFKNHIVDWAGLQRMDEVLGFLKQSVSMRECYDNFVGLSLEEVQRRKHVYVLVDSLNFDLMQQSLIFSEKKFRKVVCYRKLDGLVFDAELQKYFMEHGVKALPMQEASVRPLVRYILRNDKSPILLHEIPNGDLSAYVPTEKDSLMPSQIVMLCNSQGDFHPQKASFLSFQQLMKNYLPRAKQRDQQFADYYVQKFMLVNKVKKHIHFIGREMGLTEEEDDQ